MTGTACPAQSCYIPTANPTGNGADPTQCDGVTNIPTIWQPQYAVDGLTTTRYSTCTAGVGTEWFQVDLCRTASVSGVTLTVAAADVGDQAAGYKVEVSTNGTTWSTVAMAATVTPANQQTLTVTFTPVMARFVKFDQTGMVGAVQADGGFKTGWWSLAEFNVQCGTATPADAGDAAIPDASIDVSTDVSADVLSDVATGQ